MPIIKAKAPPELIPSPYVSYPDVASFFGRIGFDVSKRALASDNFVTGVSGWQITAEGNFEGNSGTFIGTITATSGAIGGFNIGTDYIRDVANSFGMASTVTGGDDVRFWAGDTFANRATSDFRVTESGAVTASSITITGGSINGVPISGIPNSTATDLSLMEKSSSMVFSVTDADTIAWTSGTIAMSNGRTFSINSGNTGNMAALTYIYLDTAVSSVALQTTTTYSTAMGANKILIGMAQNNTVTAMFIPYGAGQPLIDGANIGALSIVAGNIAASTITAAKMSVAQLSAITADLGTITAGAISGITIAIGSANNIFKADSNGIYLGNATFASAPFRVTPAGALTATSATISGAITATSGAIGGWTVNSTSIYTGTEDHSAYTANAGDMTIYSDGADSSIHAFNFYIDTSGNFNTRGGAMSGVSIAGIPNDSVTDLNVMEKSHNLVFSVTDADTIAWALGTIVMSNGRTFSISAGNTGNMAALTYIYLDTAVSTTALQTTTTYSTAMGANKVLIGVAQNNTVTASFIPYGAGQALVDGAQIGALSIVAGNIAASTITAAKMSVSQLSAIAADLGSITAGTIVLASSGYIRSGQTDYDTGTGFFLGISGAVAKFSIGNSSGNKITWDGTTLTIVGSSNISKIYTAGEAITSKDAVYVSPSTTASSVAFDAASGSNIVNDGAHTWSHTCTGSNRILFVSVYFTGITISSVTYAGVAMTLVNTANTTNTSVSLYYLVNPASGANNIICTPSGAGVHGESAASYTGVRQPGVQPENSTTGTSTTSPLTIALTTLNDNAWTVLAAIDEDAGLAASTGSTLRDSRTIGTVKVGIFDSNAVVHPAGSNSMSVTGNKTVGTPFAGVIASIRPVPTEGAKVYRSTALTARQSGAFIGFANASISDAADGAIIISGEVTGLSGLTGGSQYYLSDTLGLISTSAGTVTRKVAIATSATTVLITNLW